MSGKERQLLLDVWERPYFNILLLKIAVVRVTLGEFAKLYIIVQAMIPYIKKKSRANRLICFQVHCVCFQIHHV